MGESSRQTPNEVELGAKTVGRYHLIMHHSHSSDTEDYEDPQLIAAVKRYLNLLESAEPPDLEAFVAEYPPLERPLREALEGLALVHGATPRPSTQDSALPDAEFTAKPIGDFQIVGELGRGGMGIVYAAIQLSLGRRVALKVLPLASSLDAGRLQRFRNEAYAAAQLHHTNIVPVYAVGSDRGVQYYAMQLIEGRTLAEVIQELRRDNAHALPSNQALAQAAPGAPSHPLAKTSLHATAAHATVAHAAAESAATLTTAAKSRSTLLSNAPERKRHYRTMAQLAYQATLALEHAHQYGVVHRDIKPGNLLLDNYGKLWVTDFGLAQIEQSELGLTMSGDALGTARYMSPEQAAGNRAVLDHRTDIYSLGVTLYEMLTLQPAVRGHDYRQLLNQVVEQEPLAPRLADTNLPVELDTILRKALAKEPQLRYATAQAFGDDLLAWLDDKPIAAQPPTVWERISKWRKRNQRLVNVAASLLVMSSIGLLVTTFLVVREQWKTTEALAAESRQRLAAERSFQQARRAVETFSELSETELVYRPEFQQLRRRILETSLEFYRDFLSERSDDAAASQELREVSDKLERIVADLKLLDDVAPFLLLADARVREELGIDEALGEQLSLEIDDLQTARSQLGSDGSLLLSEATQLIATQLREFVARMDETIDGDQQTRLRQISRQRLGPFAFLSIEIIDALQLSHAQRQQIAQLIREERPLGRVPAREGERRDGPGRDGERRDPPPLSPFGRDVPLPAFSEAGQRSPEGRRGGRGGPERYAPPPGPGFEPFGRPDLHRIHLQTVERILELLTPEQQQTWRTLVGQPFDRRPHFDGLF